MPKHSTFRLAAAAAVLMVSIGARSTRAQDSGPDPEIERKSFKVADGFEVTLFAADPLVAKPVQINFDPAGRLWIATSTTYPQVKPGEAPNDRIVVIEDADGDGKADKSTVFADGLLIPTGVLPGDGGAYVANSTEMVYFADSDGDLKADPGSRRIVLSGFGTEDTHHIIHTFRWGPDARFWFNQSIYIHSHLETPWGVRRLNGSGVWRFDPRNLKLAVFARGMVNPWGLSWDEWGQTFCTDGAGGEGIYYAFPGSAYQSAIDVKRTLQGLNPGSPKYCSNETVGGRHLPDDWQGSIVTNDFRANRVVRYQVTGQDGTYASKLMPDVITSTDRAFRPVDVKMGPDGAIYIADWYNPIINHGEVDFRDPRRDKTHGRIWRLSAKGRPPVKRPALVGAPVEDLLERLKDPEIWTRQNAKVVLRSRGADAVVPALAAWVKKITGSDAAAEHGRLEALWVYQGLDVVEPQLLKAVLNSKEPRAREAATRVVPDWADRLPEALDLLRDRVADEHPRVRLEAVCSLSRIPTPQAIEVVMLARRKPLTPLIEYALETAANELKPVWLPAFQEGRLTFGGNQEDLGFALRAVESPAALATIVSQLEFDTVPKDQREQMLDLIAGVGGPREAALLLELALRDEKSYDAAARVRLLGRLEQMARARGVKPNGYNKELPRLFADASPAVRAAAFAVAGANRREDLRAALAGAATSKDSPDVVRSAAVAALADLGGPESAATLASLDGAGQSFAVRTTAVAALARVDANDAARRAADLLTSAPADADPAPLLEAFLKREGGGEALAAALGGKKLSADTAKLGLRYVNTAGRDAPALTARLREAAGLNAQPKPPTPSELAQVMDEVKQKGDPGRGERVFRRNDTGCMQCHAIAAAGGQVGPDLRAIGASSPLDYIVESILLPGKVIKEGFQTVVVATKDGDVFSGVKVKQDDKQMIIRDAQRESVVRLDQVRKQREGGSLMPTGLADSLTHAEFIDLVRFLSELGKPGPYGTDAKSVVRRWRLADSASARALSADPSALASAGAMAAVKWLPAYSLVSGELPHEALAAAPGQRVAFVRCEIEVSAAGLIGLSVGSPEGRQLWVDGRPVDLNGGDIQLDLSHGLHALTFAIETTAGRGPKGQRVELHDVPGSGGAAQPVGGN